MNTLFKNVGWALGSLAMMCLVAPLAGAADNMVNLTFGELEKRKKIFDDPTPLIKTLPVSAVLKPQQLAKLTFDQEAMKTAWADLVGFKAPDVVGKIAPEIKPGTYTYQDRDRLPFKSLMIPDHYNRMRAGGPPHIGAFAKVTVVPTRQYYWALPVAKASKANVGKTKQTDKGYMVEDSYVSGYPFPQPSGPHKAMQIVYNWDKRYINSDNYLMFSRVVGFNKSLDIDFDGLNLTHYLRLQGRVLEEPFGWYDARAKEKGESMALMTVALAPRDLYGNVVTLQNYASSDNDSQFMIYISGLRRARKLSGSDTQDAMGGQDLIYEDGDGFSQKISPTRYPYKYELVEEREFLVPAYTLDGSTTMTKDKKEFVNFEFERRPLYVLKLTSLDTNFVYSSRKMYFDKETLLLVATESYDQKGRLFRTVDQTFAFYPEMGMMVMNDFLAKDHIDMHSTYIKGFGVPAPHLRREDFSLQSMSKYGK